MAIDEATKEEGDLEVVARDLNVLPQVFSLCAEEDIVENCPERKKILSNCFMYFAYREIQG